MFLQYRQRTDERPVREIYFCLPGDHAAGQRAEGVLRCPGHIVSGQLVERRHEQDPAPFCPLVIISRETDAAFIERGMDIRRRSERASDLVLQVDHRMVMPGHDQPACQVWSRVGMPMDISGAIDHGPVPGKNLLWLKEPLYSGIVVSRYDLETDQFTQTGNGLRKLPVFLPAGERNIVFYIAKEEQEIGIDSPDAGCKPLQALGAPAPEIQPVPGHIRLDTEMEVCRDQYANGADDYKGRAVSDELKYHNGLNTFLAGW
jgi:hypothetical protein